MTETRNAFSPQDDISNTLFRISIMLELYVTDEEARERFINTLADNMVETAKSDEFKFLPDEVSDKNQSGTLFLYDIALKLCCEFHLKERRFEELEGLAAAAKLAEDGDALNTEFNYIEFLRAYWKHSVVTFFDCMAFFASIGGHILNVQFTESQSNFLQRFAVIAVKCALNFIRETKLIPPEAYDICQPAFAFYEHMWIKFDKEGWGQHFERCAKEVSQMVWTTCDGSLDYMRIQLVEQAHEGCLINVLLDLSDEALHKKIRQARYKNESARHFVDKHAIGYLDYGLAKIWEMFEQSESDKVSNGFVLDKQQADMFKTAVDRIHKYRTLFVALFDKIAADNGGTQSDKAPECEGLVLKPNRDAKSWYSWIDPFTGYIKSDPKYSQIDISTWSRNVCDSTKRLLKLYSEANDYSGFLKTLNSAVLAEHTLEYHADGYPYFKIEPCIAGELMVSDVNVSASLLRSAYGSFVMLLKHKSGIKKNIVDDRIRSHEAEPTAIAVHISEMESIKTNNWVLPRLGYSFNTSTDCKWVMFIAVQYAEIINNKPSPTDYETYYTIYFNEGDKIEDAFIKQQAKTTSDLDDFDFAIFRLAVSTCFFSVENHEFIQPDIPRKLVTRFAKANKDRNDADRDKVLEEARKKGFTGKIIREINLPLDDVRYENREHTGTRGPISYGYFRRAHWRQQKVNDGVKAIFVKRHRVRPDLPLKPFHGYSLRDELLERKRKFVEERGDS